MGRVAHDLTGQGFGRLTVLRRASPGGAHWLCRCECGGMLIARASNLVRGGTRSCGCLRRETTAAQARSRATHGMTGTSTYRAWSSMLTRCDNPASKYADWGGRGITIAERWRSFENFLADMGERPPGMTLDRINNDGNYEPGNCRWANHLTQTRNRGCARNLTYRGETKPIVEWAAQSHILYDTLLKRLGRGWSVERALKTPTVR